MVINLKIHKRRIVAADEDFMNDPYDFSEAVDDLAENVEEVQDTIDDMDEDDPSIEVNNNIEDHLIAECERCHGIFISAILQSDMEIDHVTGTCPLCGRESNQYLKWVVKPAETEGVEQDEGTV